MPIQFNDYIEILKRHVDLPDPVSMDRPLLDAGLDSLGVIKLIVELEERLEIVLTDEQLVNDSFQTVRSLWTTVEEARRE